MKGKFKSWKRQLRRGTIEKTASQKVKIEGKTLNRTDAKRGILNAKSLRKQSQK